MGPQHKWIMVGPSRRTDFMPDDDGSSVFVLMSLADIVRRPQRWRCERCGTEVSAARKPTRRFLKSYSVGKDCAEQMTMEVMKA